MTDHQKVLIVDDNEISATCLGICLKKMGFISIYAENGLDVLRLLSFERPDAILLDIGMEQIDGITLLKHIKREKKFSSIPVIMASGDDSGETIEKCRKYGCAGYLKKPVTMSELHKVFGGIFFRNQEDIVRFQQIKK